MGNCPHCGAALPSSGLTCSFCRADVGLWIGRGADVYGPYSLGDLREAQAQGRLDQGDMVMVGRLGTWQPLSAFVEGAPAKGPVPPEPPGVGVGPPAPVAAPAPASGSGSWPVVIIVAVVGGCLFFGLLLMAAILFPVFARAREKARQASCISNLKSIDLALLMYCQDYNECFPPAPRQAPGRRAPAPTGRQTPAADLLATLSPDDWRRVTNPYIRNAQVFVCPTTSSIDSYQFNDKLYGVRMAQVRAPAETVDLYDTGFLDGSAPGPHNGGYNVGFVDGHCKWMRSNKGVSTEP